MSTSTSDIVIIGGGVAGLTLALGVADQRSVLLVRPAQDDKGASRWAQGGIAAVLSPDDQLEDHVQDTLIAGDGLCDEAAVRFTVDHGPQAIQWLIDNGVPFTPDPDPRARYPFHLTREGGHNARRIIHADDATGRAVVDTLLDKVAAHPNITQRSDLTILHLLQNASGHCLGALGIDSDGNPHHLLATHTVLATGGASGLYRHTTTPAPSSGEGMVMAAELGATLCNLEFQQFHPTCLFDPNGPAFLISEAVRGEGGHLLNEAGERFMLALDARAELAPRDIVARAIDANIQRGTLGHVWLDVRHLGDTNLRHHFPTILAHCASRGIDITREPIPVVPAAHYSCGGIVTNSAGATDVPNLYAIGETAYTGLHGANRMASNSLLECLVYARSCALHLLSQPQTAPRQLSEALADRPIDAHIKVDWNALDELRHAMRSVMSQHVSIVRSEQGLNSAYAALENMAQNLKALDPERQHPDSLQLGQALALAQLTTLAALQRHESRGLHYSTDWPSAQPGSQPSRLTLNDLPNAWR